LISKSCLTIKDQGSQRKEKSGTVPNFLFSYR
jgi:hypothetical protein